MLRELSTSKLRHGEPVRCWYFSHDMDLVVWLENGEPVGFQLAYDKYRNEHSIAWRSGKPGLQHYVVDEGNPLAGKAQTPLLYANGAFHADAVVTQFRALSGEVPEPIVAFVIDKLTAA